MLEVPGGRLNYEVRGWGPVLSLIGGGPADADVFTRLSGFLADGYPVVTYDPRGLRRSALHGMPPAAQDLSVLARKSRNVVNFVRCFGTALRAGGALPLYPAL